ncbi:MAG: peroxide stress protein YaaA, partial [Pseudomonadota bacterium]|nr:peroxide stress protein YaaA [Pseudomonadota bacterium]
VEEAPATRPELLKDAAELARVARRLTRADLMRLMDISEKLAALNVDRFKQLDLKCEEGGVQAAFAFAGDVYAGLRARELDAPALEYAQAHVRILSGLYGLLRPLDCIQPYRLEMGAPLPTKRGATLYDFWGDRLSKALNQAAQGHADRTLVNLASREYFGAVDIRALKLPRVDVSFKEEKDGEARVLAFFAKKARGAMARFAVDARAESVDDLRAFTGMGYRWRKDLSSDREWVFTRPQP